MKSVEKFIIIYSLFQEVLCREFSISLPKSVEALSGFCVLIPCTFDILEIYNEDLQRGPTGIWLKDGTDKDSNRVFNSKTPKKNRIKGKLLENLTMKNCTTVFYNIKPSDIGVYYFRIETSASLKYTYPSSVSISVRDSPFSPSIALYKEDKRELEVEDEVLEGTLLSLICSDRSPPCLLRPPSFSWNYLPEERRLEKNHNNNTSFSFSELNFIATHLHHGLQFTCTVTYQLQNQNQSLQSSRTLQVLYAPRNTSISASPSASVLLGSSVSLSCSSDANPSVLSYIWYRENGEQIATGNNLTINNTDFTHSGLYYCRAQNQYRDQNTSIQLDVQYAPRNISISVSPSASVLLGSSVFLSCSSDANPAVLNFTWYRENGEEIGTRNHLTINTTESTHSGLYYCRAQNYYGDQNTSIQLDVQYAPKVSSSSSCNSSQNLIMCSCEIYGNPAPKLEWRISGQSISSFHSVHIKEDSVGKMGLRSLISIPHPENDALMLQCVGGNKLGVTSQHFFSLKKTQCSAGGFGVEVSSVMMGVAVGATGMMLLCVIYLCVRKVTPPSSGKGDVTALDMVDYQNEDAVEESVYANKTLSSESLHYSTIVFPNGGGSEIRGLSKLTADYATVSHAHHR